MSVLWIALQAVSRASYYDIPIELIRVIHNMCEPEEYGEFRIADSRLFFVSPDYFEAYKRSQLVSVTVKTSMFKTIYTTFRGNRHGDFKQWNDNGQLIYYLHYIRGKKHGEHKIWYDNGQLCINAYYVNDKFHGRYEYIAEDGQVRRSCIYVDGAEQK
jgi:hypothetical protein